MRLLLPLLLLAGLASASATARRPKWFFGTTGQAAEEAAKPERNEEAEVEEDGSILKRIFDQVRQVISMISPERLTQLLDKIPFEEVLFELNSLDKLWTDPEAADRLAGLLAPHVVHVLEAVSHEELTTERAVKLFIKFAIITTLAAREEEVDEAVEEVTRFLTELRVTSIEAEKFNHAFKHLQVNRQTLRQDEQKRIYWQWHAQNQDQTKGFFENTQGYILSTVIQLILPGHASYVLNKIPFPELIHELRTLDKEELARDPEAVERLAAVLAPTVIHILEAMTSEELTTVRAVHLIIQLSLETLGPEALGPDGGEEALTQVKRALVRLKVEGQQVRAAGIQDKHEQ
jgi:hypothetical protein